MAQSGYTPIQLYFSTTAAAVPLAANLAQGELAINIVDGKLYYENSSGAVTLLASAAGASGDVVGPASATDNALARFDLTTGKLIQNSVGILSDAGVLTGLTGITSSGSITFSSLTSGRVPYATTAGLLTDSANLLYAGTDLTVYGLTVGRGAGAVSTNTAVGASALNANTTGASNAALGYQSALTNTTGTQNTYLGAEAGKAGTTANGVTFVGFQAGNNNTATNNVGVGHAAMGSNTSGASNTAVGSGNYGNSNGVMGSNTTGSFNTALGGLALGSNTTASNNTAVGYLAGYTNTTGVQSNYVGRQAGYTSNANYCTMMGDQAGYASTGAKNTFIGYYAGGLITSGANNTILGGFNGNQGSLDIRTASNYIVLSDGDGNPRAYWNSTGSATFAADGNDTNNSKYFAFYGNSSLPSSGLTQQYGIWIAQAGNRYTNQTAIYAEAGEGVPNSSGAFASLYYGVHSKVQISGQAQQQGSGVYGVNDVPSWNYNRLCAGVQGLSTPASTTFNNAYGLDNITGGFGGHFVAHGKASSCGVYADAYLDASPGAGTVARPLVCGTNGSFIMYVMTNGGIANYSSNNTNLSDQREKKNIALAGNYLDKICAIPVKTFQLVNEGDDADVTLGVIAQDVQAIAPEFVTEDAWPTKEEPDRKRLSLYQTDMHFALMKCIQELKSELDSVKAELATLKGA